MPKLISLIITKLSNWLNHHFNLNLANSKAGTPHMHQPLKIGSKNEKSNNTVHEPHLNQASWPLLSLKCPSPICSLSPPFHPSTSSQPQSTGPSTAQRLPIWLRDKEYLIELLWSNNNRFVFLDAIGILMKFFICNCLVRRHISLFNGFWYREELQKLSRNSQGAKRKADFLALEFVAFRIWDPVVQANEATWTL